MNQNHQSGAGFWENFINTHWNLPIGKSSPAPPYGRFVKLVLSGGVSSLTLT